MNDSIDVAGDVLADLVDAYLRTIFTPAAEEWRTLLGRLRGTVLSGNVAPKEYWTDLYRRRQEVAAALDTGMADDLTRTIDELATAESSSLALVLFSSSGYGYLMWISPDCSSLASCIRVKDRRGKADASP